MNRWLMVLSFAGFMACSSGDGGDAGDVAAVPDVVDLAAGELAVDVALEDEGSADMVLEDLFVPEEVAAELLPEDVPEDMVQPEDLAMPSDLDPADFGPAPAVKEYVEPELLELPVWLVSYVADPADDPIGDALDKGSFSVPDGPGIDENGVEWIEREPGEGGTMGYAGYGLFYAAAKVPVEEGGLLVKANKFYQVFANGAVQPGDPYNTNNHRTPVPAQGGVAEVVGVAFQAINDPKIQIWQTSDELYFHGNDLTTPQFYAGHDTEQWLGAAVVNLTYNPVRKVTARVVENEWFEETVFEMPALAPAATNQVPFHLVLKQIPDGADLEMPVTVRVESPFLENSYEREFILKSVDGNPSYRQTRLSNVDHSVQFLGVRAPTEFDADKQYSLLLSLHGAGVNAKGQTGSYGAKDWIYHVAPTNRRPFGFDWEEWGRLDGLETLEYALEHYNIDPTRVYVSGHSMGGHGTWQFGVLLAGRFATVGPSAGWSSFYSYGGSQEPTGAFARARASSDTLNYVSNLANKPIYIIHGDKDDNVPISEAYLMQEHVEPLTDDFHFHIQEGAGHWWDGPEAPGADCVDWPPLFELMKERTIDPSELNFEYTTPAPWVVSKNSYVTIMSQETPYEDSTITSASEDGAAVALSTYNVRGLTVDGTALLDKGVESFTINDEAVELEDGAIEWGDLSGKNPQVQGPLNQVWHRPFCYVYPDTGPSKYREYASYLTSAWNIIGNGHSCAIPESKAGEYTHENFNLIYLGIPRDRVPVPEEMKMSWDNDSVDINGVAIAQGCLLFIFPEKGHLSAVITAAEGYEWLMFWHQPFSSRSGLPDYIAWTPEGAVATGFFAPDWSFDPALGVGAGTQ